MRPQNTIRHRQRQPLFTSQLSLGRKHRPDYSVLILSITLLVIGLVLVYALGPALGASKHVSNSFFLNRQIIAIALSLIAFLIAAKVPFEWWRQVYKPLLGIAIIATMIALLMPVNPAYPAHRWVRLGSLSFQSVELVKFAVMIWMAGFLAECIARGQITNFKAAQQPIIIALGAIALVVAGIQSDLGSFGVIALMALSMLMVAGVPLKKIFIFGAIGLVVSSLFIMSTPYRRSRIETFINPSAKCQTTGYQACQALITVGSGGIVGLGLGGSVQAYGYLPEAANDSIFAIYAEKFGLIGCWILLALFVWLFSKIKFIAEMSTDNFTRLIVVGVLTWLSVQSAVNIGAMLGLAPLKGITLPFISYGGTSVVFIALAMGLVFQASQYTAFSATRENSSNPRRPHLQSNRPNRGMNQ
jgi:cell division protein FtsW